MPGLSEHPIQRIALGIVLSAVIPLLSGCGSQHVTEAAAMEGAHASVSDSPVVATVPGENKPTVSTISAASSPTPAPVADMTPRTSVAMGQTNEPPVSAPRPALAAVPAKSEPAGDDDAHRKRIIGKWFQHKDEKRTITVKQDGTANIVAEIDDYRQYIVGKKLEFDIQWTLEGGKLTFVTTGGKPAESIKYITALYGKSRVYRIIEFVEDRLMLKKDDTGEDEPAWTKLAE